MTEERHDGIECDCGAVTAIGNIGKKETPVLFVGGAYKNGLIKFSDDGENKRCCIWCGKEWPESVRVALKGGHP